jgi:tetratricopeptide (TPR) repeat protein
MLFGFDDDVGDGRHVLPGAGGWRAASTKASALALEQQGKNVEAEAAWRFYLKAHPSNPEPYAHLGLLEARQEHYKEAVPLIPQGPGAESGDSQPASEPWSRALQGRRTEAGDCGIQAAAQEPASSVTRGTAADHPAGDGALWAGRICRGGSLSETSSRCNRSAESSLAAGSGAQLPVVQAVPVRFGYLSRDSAAERGVGGGRYAGRRGAG